MLKRLAWLRHPFPLALAPLALLSSLSADAGRLAIVVDDIGYSRDAGERVLALPNAISIAVLPFTPHAMALARRAQAIGKDILLHQPLESEDESVQPVRTLTLNMSPDDIKKEVEAELHSWCERRK